MNGPVHLVAKQLLDTCGEIAEKRWLAKWQFSRQHCGKRLGFPEAQGGAGAMGRLFR